MYNTAAPERGGGLLLEDERATNLPVRPRAVSQPLRQVRKPRRANVNAERIERPEEPEGTARAPVPERPFHLKECCILISPTGRSAANLRELHQGLDDVDDDVVYHHVFRCHLKPSYERSVFPNDFAIWSARALGDFALAEKLASFDPYLYESVSEIRQVLADIIDDHLRSRDYIPWAKWGFNFHFERSLLFAMDSGLSARSPSELAERLYEVDVSSIYYHFFDARRRHGDSLDDFSRWLEESEQDGALQQRIASLDFHMLGLEEVRGELIEILSRGTAAP